MNAESENPKPTATADESPTPADDSASDRREVSEIAAEPAADQRPEATQAAATAAAVAASDQSQPPPLSLSGPPGSQFGAQRPPTLLWLGGLGILLLGLGLGYRWLTLVGALMTLSGSGRLLWPQVTGLLAQLSPPVRTLLLAVPAFALGLWGLFQAIGLNAALQAWGRTIRWEVVGAIGDFLGAIGQIFVALLALYVAWRQYIISRDLTQQQNRITQQQTIDAYFQGISELVLDDEGLLEDWPQERIIAEARTEAILNSVDALGKAKVIRFLSRSKLLTPLQRDRHLGRPILDGVGGYAEDRVAGIRVIDLGAMLAGCNLSGTDLRWSDLSDANLIRVNLSRCDLVKANLTRTILYQANLRQADLKGTQLFQGRLESASPRSRSAAPDFETGAFTGAVIEDADLSGVQRLSEAQRQYCCRWGGARTRSTIPGGCEGIPDCLGRSRAIAEPSH